MLNITSRDLGYAVILSFVLVAVILLFVAIHQFLIEPSRKRRQVSRRLSEGHKDYLRQIQILKEGAAGQTSWWLKLLTKFLGETRLDRLRRLMLQADIHHDPGIFLMWIVYLGIIGWLAGTLLLKSTPMGFLGCSLGLIPYLYLKRKRRAKTLRFEAQMPDAMEMLSRSLRVGHTLSGALQLVGEEIPDPMGKEMAVAYEEQQFGISTSEALLHMVERVESMDLRYFVGAVLIQQDTGGNLAELMENIAKVIRSRLNFKAKVRGLTAMGRLSTKIMIFIPILTFFVLLATARQYVGVLVDTSVGRTMLMSGVVALTIGAFLLKKMIQAVESA